MGNIYLIRMSLSDIHIRPAFAQLCTHDKSAYWYRWSGHLPTGMYAPSWA
jgi:hypothetical protein